MGAVKSLGDSVGSLIGAIVFGAARAVVERARKFSRTRSPERQKTELEEWNRNHSPTLAGPCAVCGKPNAVDTEHCNGPVRRWPMR